MQIPTLPPLGNCLQLPDITNKCITIMQKYTKVKVLRISEVQDQTLKKMKLLGVDVSQFCRTAIKEKIKRDYHELLPKKPKQYCPFSNGTLEIIEQ